MTKPKRSKSPAVDQQKGGTRGPRRKTAAEPDTSWFREREAEVGKSARQVAALLNIDIAQYSRSCAGGRKFQPHELAQLTKILDQPAEEIIFRATGVRSERVGVGTTRVSVPKAIPVVGWLDATWTYREGKVLGPGTVHGFAGLKENAVAIRSQTDGLWDGAILFVQPGNSIELDAVGRLCLVELKTGEKLVRHLARGYQLGEWKLTDLKGRSEVLEVVSAAPILWIRP